MANALSGLEDSFPGLGIQPSASTTDDEDIPEFESETVFARFIPVSEAAKWALSEVAKKMREEPKWENHAAPHLHVPNDSLTLPSAAFAGYYKLATDVLPKKVSKQWVIGSRAETADFLLTTTLHAYNVGREHASLGFGDGTSIMFLLAGSREVVVDQQAITKQKAALALQTTAIIVGHLVYKLEFTDGFDSRAFYKMYHRVSKQLGFKNSVDAPSTLSPTPNSHLRSLGSYVLHPVSHGGGFGKVAFGVNSKTGKSVVAKTIAYTRANDADVDEEIRMLERFKHANVISLEHVFYPPGNYDDTFDKGLAEITLITVPTLPMTLDALQSMNVRAFSALTIYTIARDIFTGLAYIHEQGCMHRDMKPSNIAICLNPPKAVILDLGQCADYGESTEVVGTPVYRAPEVAVLCTDAEDDFQSVLPYGPPMDVWATALSLIDTAWLDTRFFETWFNDPAQARDRHINSARYDELMEAMVNTEFSHPILKTCLTRAMSWDAAGRPTAAKLASKFDKHVRHLEASDQAKATGAAPPATKRKEVGRE